MSIKVRAFLYALGIFVAIGVGSVAAVQILNMIPEAYYLPLFVVVVTALIFNLVYSICKATLEYKEKLQQIANKK
jgi:uncharacterized membrane protein YfcA